MHGAQTDVGNREFLHEYIIPANDYSVTKSYKLSTFER